MDGLIDYDLPDDLPDDYPPVPSLPPPSELQKYESSPPDYLSPIRRYRADREAFRFITAAFEASNCEERVFLLNRALQIFPFCVEALIGLADSYVRFYVPQSLEKAEETYKVALSACRLLWPDMEQKSKIDWNHVDNQPFLRTYHWLGAIQTELGKVEEAIEKFRFLLRVDPTDTEGVRVVLFWAHLQTGEYRLAEEVAEKYNLERKSNDALVCYGFLLVDFLKFKSGVCTEANLKATLVRALTLNVFVPSILKGSLGELPYRPQQCPPGFFNEAVEIVYRTIRAWRNIPGILEWLCEQQSLGGKKPNDDGTILFQLLQRGRVLVSAKNKRLSYLTTNVKLMPGQTFPYFYLAPGMKEHNPAKIVAFDCDKIYEESSFPEKYKSFSYDDVAEIPFWNVLHTCKAFGKVEQKCSGCLEQRGKFRCSVCQVTSYCSRACQKKDWKKCHKAQCPKFIKT